MAIVVGQRGGETLPGPPEKPLLQSQGSLGSCPANECALSHSPPCHFTNPHLGSALLESSRSSWQSENLPAGLHSSSAASP